MKIKRFLRQFITDPNSSEGLMMRAESMREHGDKESDSKAQEKCYLYAEVLVEIARQKWSSNKNKQFIKENLHLHLNKKGRGWLE